MIILIWLIIGAINHVTEQIPGASLFIIRFTPYYWRTAPQIRVMTLRFETSPPTPRLRQGEPELMPFPNHHFFSMVHT